MKEPTLPGSVFSTPQNIGDDLASMSVQRSSPAEWTYERVVRSINEFEAKLDNDHEIGARLVQAPGDIVSIDDVGYWGPDLMIFYGTNPDGNPVELLQHYSQVNVVLIAVKKSTEKPKRIGFRMVKKLEDEAEAKSDD